MGTTFFWQSSGILVTNNYSPTRYKSLGFSVGKQLLYPAAWLTFTIGMGVCAFVVIDRLPRNMLLGTGMLGCMSCLIVVAALVASFADSNNSAALHATVAMFFVFQVFDPICLSEVPLGCSYEIFPNHLRARGSCLASATVSLANVVYLQSAPVAFANIGWKFYILFIVLSLIGAVIFLSFWPGTRGLPLEEVGALFGDADEVAIYQSEIFIDPNTNTGVDIRESRATETAHVEELSKLS